MPSLQIPNFLSLNIVLVVKTALILSLLGAIESLLAALVVDDMIGTKHNSDRELIGQGIANFVAAIFGNLIGTGAIVRSAVNVNAGGRGRASGVIHAVVLLVIVVQFGGLASQIPLAVLGGILMATALNMVEYHETYKLSSISKEALIVISVTTILTVTTDLTIAVAVGTLLSGLIMLYNMGNCYVSEYKIDNDGLNSKVKSFTIEGALFFGVTDNIVNSMLVKSAGADIIVVNMMNSPVVDATGVMVIGNLKEIIDNAGKRLILTGLKESTYEKLVKLEILDGTEKEINLGRITEAIIYAKKIASAKDIPSN